jgi:hypothetical protein
MSFAVPPQPNLSLSWLRTLEHVQAQPDGRDIHVTSTITGPLAAEDAGIRSVLDDILPWTKRKGLNIQPVDTVAATIFSPIYNNPGFDWSPAMRGTAEEQALDNAAADFYAAYTSILPRLTDVEANNRGTYFGRMISWPGKEAGGINQVAKQIRTLRNHTRSVWNAMDITVGGEGEEAVADAASGVQTHRATDNSLYGFPCLVHVDLTLFRGRVNMHATYRHQYLITKAYGNAVGLSQLLNFICHQSGRPAGELVIDATMADAEYTYWGGKSGVESILDRARAATAT